VIPVLVDRTPMPGSEDLPDSLAPLAFRHAIVVDQGLVGLKNESRCE
jgi:hypothetical protein